MPVVVLLHLEVGGREVLVLGVARALDVEHGVGERRHEGAPWLITPRAPPTPTTFSPSTYRVAVSPLAARGTRSCPSASARSVTSTIRTVTPFFSSAAAALAASVCSR